MERLWTKSFIGLTLAMFFLGLGFYLLLPTLPLYIKDLNIGESELGLIIGVFTLSAVVVRPVIGGLLDRFGRRFFIVAGLILFAIAMFLYNYVTGIFLLFLLRLLHGGGWAISTTSIGTSITDVIPSLRRSEGMGWYGMSMSISMALGPIIGVWLVNSYSFRHLIALASCLSVVAILIALATKVPAIRSDNKRKMVFFDKSVLSISVAIFFLALTYGGITTFLPLFAASIQVNAGTFFLVYAIALTLTRPVAGRLADRYSEGSIIIPSIILTIIALLILSLSDGLLGVMASAILYGIGFGSAQPTLQSAILDLVSPAKKGIANASFFTAMDLGIGLGSILLGFISQFFGFSALFATCAGSGIIALLIFTGFVRRTLLYRKEEHNSNIDQSR
ncbi:MFS transporter [Heyndrickxia camelliae]|uniref:MFS transporter n=1 Tax=Heyndrickxia camelliae TaxID=1707093 RepID=A0A2N3LR77_9BACI|nr:MFS transporter [Heyndrickxia camelliae]PKR87111.1 MFS transporter [Heyndrickxia camelliae]